MTVEDKKKALAAAGILQNEIFLDALEQMDRKYVDAWRMTTDPIAREALWFKQNMLREFENEFFQEIQSAAVESRGKDEEIAAAFAAVKTKRSRKRV